MPLLQELKLEYRKLSELQRKVIQLRDTAGPKDKADLRFVSRQLDDATLVLDCAICRLEDG